MIKELTTYDIAQLLGAAKLIKKYAHHLALHVDAAVNNYESTDFDCGLFLGQQEFIRENVFVIEDCVRITKKVIELMSNENQGQ